MKRNKYEDPAFARSGLFTDDVNYEPQTGLTKDEYFSIKIAQAFLSNEGTFIHEDWDSYMSVVFKAKDAFIKALKALEK